MARASGLLASSSGSITDPLVLSIEEATDIKDMLPTAEELSAKAVALKILQQLRVRESSKPQRPVRRQAPNEYKLTISEFGRQTAGLCICC